MGRMWSAGQSRLAEEEHEPDFLALLTRPRVHHAGRVVETLLAALTDASDRAKISGVGPLKAAWRRSAIPAVSKPSKNPEGTACFSWHGNWVVPRH